MLPITRNRSFHVPHSLATAAAVVALATALGWDALGDDDGGAGRVEASQGPVASLEAQRSESGDEAGDTTRNSGNNAGGTRESGRDCDPDMLSNLLPLVLPRMSGI